MLTSLPTRLPARLTRRRRDGEHRHGDVDRAARIRDTVLGSLPPGHCGVAWSAARAVVAAESTRSTGSIAGSTSVLLASAADARSGASHAPLAKIADEFVRLRRSGVDLVTATSLTTGPLWPAPDAGPLEATVLELDSRSHLRALTVDGPPPLMLDADGVLTSITARPVSLLESMCSADGTAEFRADLAPGSSVLVLSGRTRNLLDERDITRLSRDCRRRAGASSGASDLVGSLWSLATARASKSSARELLIAIIDRDRSRTRYPVAASERTASGASTTLAPSIPGLSVSQSSS